eukprot:gene8095-12556_t
MSEFKIESYTPYYEVPLIELWKEGTLGVASKVSVFSIFQQTLLFLFVPVLLLLWKFYKLFFFVCIIYYLYCDYYSEQIKGNVKKYVKNQTDMKSSEAIIKNFLKHKRDHFWVITKEKTLYGCVAVKEKSSTTAELLRMSVNKNIRRQGLGQKLYHELEKFCIEQKYKYIYLETTTLQKEAIAFYEKLGFKKIGTYQKDPYFPIAKMVKKI